MNLRRKYYICIYYCLTIKEMTCNACKGGQIVFPHSMQTRNLLLIFFGLFHDLEPGPQDVHRSFAMVVVVVFVMLVILLGTAAIMYSKGHKSSRPSFENPLYFKVSNSEGPDNKTLINNAELECNEI